MKSYLSISIISIISILIITLFINMKNIENFYNNIEENSTTSHTVNLPINTTFSCKNVCGSLNRCLITGEQCSSDIDCYGCQPKKTITNNY